MSEHPRSVERPGRADVVSLRGEGEGLVDLLDKLLDTGVVVLGDVLLDVADVDLVRVGLRLVLEGVEERERPPSVSGTRSGGAASPRPAREASPGPAVRAAGAPADAGAPPAATAAEPAARASEPTEGSRIPDTRGREPTAATVGRHLERLTGEAAAADDPRRLQQGLAGLVLALMETLRELMERQALRRMERGTLTEDEVERLGTTLQAARQQIEDLRDQLGLDEEDLNLDLGPLGRLR